MVRILFSLVLMFVGLNAFAQNQGEPNTDFACLVNSSYEIPECNKTKWKELKSPVNLFIVSDLGRNGYYQQKPIASLMGEMAEKIGPDAVLALGDTHHFQGIQSVYDPLWQSNFEQIYNHPELMVEWNAICGNHEYRGNTQAVIDYSKVSRRWNMPAKYYSKTFRGTGTTVKVVFIDTTPIIDKYYNDSIDYPDAAKQNVEDQLAWLENELAHSTEDWIIVAGHHPIYADTPKDEAERSDMQRKIDTILNRHKVDMYIGGHIHNFQHIRKNGIDYVVNSSGSQSREKVNKVDGTEFVSGDPGFSIISADSHRLRLSMIDSKGKILHQINKTK